MTRLQDGLWEESLRSETVWPLPLASGFASSNSKSPQQPDDSIGRDTLSLDTPSVLPLPSSQLATLLPTLRSERELRRKQSNIARKRIREWEGLTEREPLPLGKVCKHGLPQSGGAYCGTCDGLPCKHFNPSFSCVECKQDRVVTFTKPLLPLKTTVRCDPLQLVIRSRSSSGIGDLIDTSNLLKKILGEMSTSGSIGALPEPVNLERPLKIIRTSFSGVNQLTEVSTLWVTPDRYVATSEFT